MPAAQVRKSRESKSGDVGGSRRLLSVVESKSVDGQGSAALLSSVESKSVDVGTSASLLSIRLAGQRAASRQPNWGSADQGRRATRVGRSQRSSHQDECWRHRPLPIRR